MAKKKSLLDKLESFFEAGKTKKKKPNKKSAKKSKGKTEKGKKESANKRTKSRKAKKVTAKKKAKKKTNKVKAKTSVKKKTKAAKSRTAKAKTAKKTKAKTRTAKTKKKAAKTTKKRTAKTASKTKTKKTAKKTKPKTKSKYKKTKKAKPKKSTKAKPKISPAKKKVSSKKSKTATKKAKAKEKVKKTKSKPKSLLPSEITKMVDDILFPVEKEKPSIKLKKTKPKAKKPVKKQSKLLKENAKKGKKAMKKIRKEEKQFSNWADAVVDVLKKRKKKEFVCEGMWTPSGFFHIGNARPEIFTPYAVKKALETYGFKARQNFIIDDFDAVRKIPKGLKIPEEDYDKYLGFPCATAPSPLPGYPTWAEAFVSQVRKYISFFGVDLNIISAYETYKKGEFNDLISFSLEYSKDIVNVWNKIAGTDKKDDFVPLQVLCGHCKKIYYTTVIGWDKKNSKVSYSCKCGHKGKLSPYNGNAKLHWRVHWVAHWILHKVDFESAGKDHFSKGGSVDVGQALMKKVFKVMPPHQIPTEFIQLKGEKMSGSVGNVFDLEQWLQVASPELFRYLNFSYRPEKVIEFDLRDNSFILLNDRFERSERIYFGKEKAENDKMEKKHKRDYELSKINKPDLNSPLIQVPFSVAVKLVQLINPEEKFNEIMNLLYTMEQIPNPNRISDSAKIGIKEKLIRSRNWVEKYAPDQFRLAFLDEVDAKLVREINDKSKEIFSDVAGRLEVLNTPEEIQSHVFEMAKSLNYSPKKVFQDFYKVLLGRKYGPKLGTLILALGKQKVIKRLKEVA